MNAGRSGRANNRNFHHDKRGSKGRECLAVPAQCLQLPVTACSPAGIRLKFGRCTHAGVAMWSRLLALALLLLPAPALADVKEKVAALAPSGLVLVPLHSDYDSLVWASRRVAGCG